MHIVIATPLYPPDIGGPATYARELELGLQERGVVVTLVPFSAVRHLPKLFRHHAYYQNVRKAAEKADAIFALDPVSVGLPAMQVAKRLNKPLYVKVVGDYAWEQGVSRFGVTASLDEFVAQKRIPFFVSFLRFVQSSVARYAARVIVPSAYLKGIVSTWGVPEENILVIPNAVSLDAIGILPKSVAELPRPRVVSAGRLVPWKGMSGLIDAVVQVRSGGVSASLVIVGEGEQQKPLEKQAEATLGEHYAFTGRLSHADTLATIKDAEVFVLNSTYEGLSHLLIEATALGTPVVVTSAGGNTEVVTDGVNGIVVPVNDTVRLAEALSRILTDARLRATLSEGAELSAKRFSTSVMIDATYTALTSTV